MTYHESWQSSWQWLLSHPDAWVPGLHALGCCLHHSSRLQLRPTEPSEPAIMWTLIDHICQVHRFSQTIAHHASYDSIEYVGLGHSLRLFLNMLLKTNETIPCNNELFLAHYQILLSTDSVLCWFHHSLSWQLWNMSTCWIYKGTWRRSPEYSQKE